MRNVVSRSCWLVMLAVLALLLVGCTYKHKTKGMTECWSCGDVAGATSHINKLVNDRLMKKCKGPDGAETFELRDFDDWDGDAVVFLLEQGAVLRAAGQYEQSTEAFDRAHRKMDACWNKPVVEISREARTLIDNLAACPYDGYAYDQVMACTYMGLNYLQCRRPLDARTILMHAWQEQQKFVEKNHERIEKAQAKAKEDEAYKHVTADPAFNTAQGEAFGEIEQQVQNLKGYVDYQNPFTLYLYGLCLAILQADTGDLSNAKVAMDTVAGMVGDHKFVEADRRMVDGMLQGKAELEPLTYVIFETGRGPLRDEIVLHIPIPTGSIRQANITYFGAAFPKLIFHSDYVRNLRITVGGVSEYTLPLASMDGIVAREFKNELPLVIAKTILSATVKAIATYELRKNAGIGGLVAGVAWGVATNHADLRTWTTLPKEIQVARIPTPADRMLTIAAGDDGPPLTVLLDEGVVNLVHVKSISPAAPLLVSQTVLK